MVHSCCVVGCTTRQGPGMSLHRIPSHPEERRCAWLLKIKRRLHNGKDWQPTSSARICGRHFIEGKPNDNPEHPDYIPNKDMPGAVSRAKDLQRFMRVERRRMQEPMDLGHPDTQSNPDSLAAEEDAEAAATLLDLANASIAGTSKTFESTGSQTASFHDDMDKLRTARQHRDEMEAAKTEIRTLKTENASLTQQLEGFKFTFANLKVEDIAFFTGINKPLFLWIFSCISCSSIQFGICHRRLPLHDHLLIVLMKLRLAFSNRYLAKKFSISESVISKLLRRWIPKLGMVLKAFIVWPEREVVRSHVPSCFKPAFSKVVSIIDCFEVYIQRASNKTPRCQTWSNYKKHNTIKFLVSITPSGAINFISNGWGGKVSDKQVTCDCGYLEHLIHGDEILADRGFLVSEEVATMGGILRLPAFTRGKPHLSASEVISSHKIANVRIHVERVIGRMRNWEFLKQIVCLQQTCLLNDAVIIIGALCNINPPIVNE